MNDNRPIDGHPFQPTERAWPPVMMRDVVAASPAHVATVTALTLVSQVLDFLAEGDRNMVAVTDDYGQLLGVVHAVDVQEALNQFGCDAFAIRVTDIMQADPLICAISDSPHVVLAEMHEQGIRRATVVAKGHVVGSVAPRDIIGTLNDLGEPL